MVVNRDVSYSKSSGVNAGVSTAVDELLGKQYGLSRAEIKAMDARSLQEVKLKVDAMAEYVLAKRMLSDVLVRYGAVGDMLLGELSELMALHAQKTNMLKSMGKFPLDDPEWVDSQDRILKLLVDLKKLGIEESKVDVMASQGGFTVEVANNVVDVVPEEVQESVVLPVEEEVENRG
jgi:hypothetical protein